MHRCKMTRLYPKLHYTALQQTEDEGQKQNLGTTNARHNKNEQTVLTYTKPRRGMKEAYDAGQKMV